MNQRVDPHGVTQSSRCPVRNPLHRALLLGGGFVFVGLGITGAFVPLMPTTVFLILAAACFVRSSDRSYRWLLNHRFLGIYVRNYLNGEKMPLRAKIVTIGLIIASISFSLYLLYS